MSDVTKDAPDLNPVAGQVGNHYGCFGVKRNCDDAVPEPEMPQGASRSGKLPREAGALQILPDDVRSADAEEVGREAGLSLSECSLLNWVVGRIKSTQIKSTALVALTLETV